MVSKDFLWVRDKMQIATDPAPGDDTFRTRLLPLAVLTCWILWPNSCAGLRWTNRRVGAHIMRPWAATWGRPYEKDGKNFLDYVGADVPIGPRGGRDTAPYERTGDMRLGV